MPEVTTIRQKRERKLDIPINREGDTLTVKWNPVNMTEDVFQAIVALSKSKGEDSNPFDAADIIVVPLMTWWDLTVDGEPYPITAENVASFGLDFVVAIADAIQRDFRLGDDTKKDSGGA